MAEIIVYTLTTCPFCVRAIELLNNKGLSYKEIITDGNTELREESKKLSGGKTSVPQIFINGVSVGGCDELYAADANGELDRLLRGN